MIAGHSGRERDERGAVAVMTALAVVVVLAATAFAVDLGMSRASARDMQAVADSVALDTARSLPSCDAATLKAAANQSLARQGTTIGQDSPLVVTPGHIDPTTKKFVAGSNGSGMCDAVKVTSAAKVDYAFAPVIGTSSGTTSRSAVGTTSPPAMCFSAGTRTLVLDTHQSALGPVLKQILGANLGVGGYDGLIDLKDLSVPLADLDAALVVGTGQSLVDATDISLSSLLIAQATVLENNGDAAQAVVLRSIAAQVSSLSVNVAKFLSLDTEGDAGLSASVNALDLAGTAIVAAATIANGKNAVKVDDLGISLIGLADANVTATIIEPPVIACGGQGVTAKTAQVDIKIDAGLLDKGLLGSLVKVATVSLTLHVAQGTAILGQVSCASSSPTVTVNGVTSLVGVNGSITLLSLLGLPGIKVPLALAVDTQKGDSHTFIYPPGSGLPAEPMHTFGGTPLTLKLSAAGIDLGIVSLLGNVLNPIVNGVLGLLGIKLGTMDVTVLGRPSCSGVRLVG